MQKYFEDEVKKHFFGKLFEDIIGYWRIYDYLKLRYYEISGHAITIKSEDEFWYYILGDRFGGEISKQYEPLRSGQLIQAYDFFITEWAPKLPGQIWTTEGAEDFIEGHQRTDSFIKLNDKIYCVLDPYGKKKVVSAGYGSIRINPSVNNDDFYMYMSLVTHRKWNCDFGIPLVVSKPVYEEYLKYSKHGAPWVEKLEGILCYQHELPIKVLIPTAIGAAISKQTEKTLQCKPFLPKCYVYVKSPLAVRFRYNDSHPKCVAWTMFETNLKDDRYRFTYTKFNPMSLDSIRNAVEFINYYVQEFDGTSIITDFDGIEPKLQAEIPISDNPFKTKITTLKKVFSKLDKWVKKILS